MPEGDTIHFAANRIRPVLEQGASQGAGGVRFPRSAWLRIRRGEREVLQLNGPVLRTIAGIGNLWKVEGCFAAGIDPWRPTGEVSDDEALAIVDETRPRMQRSAADGIQDRFRTIYGRAGRPCPRCVPPATILLRGQGDGNRPTYWCERCQS